MKMSKRPRLILYSLLMMVFILMNGCSMMTPAPMSLQKDSGNLIQSARANTVTTASPMASASMAAPSMAAPVANSFAGGAQDATKSSDEALASLPLPSGTPMAQPTVLDIATAPPISPVATSTPALEPTATPVPTPAIDLASKFFFFSYDDSASTVGAELTKNAIKNGQLPEKSWARAYEFFNYEKFDTANQEKTGLFNVSMGLWKHTSLSNKEKTLYDLGAYVSSPTIDMAARKNMVLTLLVDVSGSMDEPSAPSSYEVAASSKLELVRYGLTTLFDSLKPGDVVNICQFSSDSSTLLENYQYDSADPKYMNVVKSISTLGSTNLNAGIDEAYKVATKYYDSNKNNRVVIITDAYANTGEVNPEKISTRTRINNLEGIYFSGIGVGQDFNEAFLNKLTEAGKGAYFSIISKTDAKRAFNDRLIALLNVAAKDVQFRIDYPAGLKHTESAAEQVSTVQSEVTPTNFSFNTSQFFLEGFEELNSAGLADQTIKLTVMYKDPETGVRVTEVYEKRIADLIDKNIGNIKDAYTIQLLTKLIKGDLTSDAAKAIISGFEGYSSRLFGEYKNLINTWINLPKSTYIYNYPTPTSPPVYY